MDETENIPLTAGIQSDVASKLFFLRDNQRISVGQLMPDHPYFPGQELRVLPYYMNKNDDPELGVWKLETAGFKARVTTVGAPGGIDYVIAVPDEEKDYTKAGPEDIEKAVSLLNAWADKLTLPESPPAPPKKPRVWRRLGQSLLASRRRSPR